MLPQPKPWAGRKYFIVPSIRGRDVACAKRSNIGSFEHLLELLDVVNDAVDIHIHAS
jgi:hypothetical protein